MVAGKSLWVLDQNYRVVQGMEKLAGRRRGLAASEPEPSDDASHYNKDCEIAHCHRSPSQFAHAAPKRNPAPPEQNISNAMQVASPIAIAASGDSH
jgi:hypothetical protein